MTALSVALLNLKPGTGKTTSAVWLAHIFAQAGKRVLLVDDTFTSGARAQSAASALSNAGAEVVAIASPPAVQPRKMKRVLPNRVTVAICGGEDRNAYRHGAWKCVGRGRSRNYS
jgi:chromosome partitioning protein